MGGWVLRRKGGVKEGREGRAGFTILITMENVIIRKAPTIYHFRRI